MTNKVQFTRIGCFAVLAALIVGTFSLAFPPPPPARPADIAAAIANAPPECHAILRARLMARISMRGAISERVLRRITSKECTVSGAQFSAAATAE